jgi:tetratricopeptide (TPR) repeat protein
MVVESYGGVIEKFIGDAVMAVWGASVVREDDAERAVQAALEIVDAVAAFGEEVGAPSLRARAGVVTGQAAAMNSRHEEGIVVGDRVNTASRVQSAAAPGTVLVDEVTRQVARTAVLFEDAGQYSVKGKAEPLHLWRAVRVAAGLGDPDREQTVEPPFIGRDTELRLVKDLLDATMERGAARLTLITGEAGIGKSHLRREFFAHLEGLADIYLWHLGRCLSHGDGIAYWALAEMVRQRLGIPDEAPTAVAAQKLDYGLSEWIPDPQERDFISPRLGALLGVAQPGLDRPELFAGWRLFFERLAARQPVVMVFEGLQWADQGLLDFIDGLLDWSLRSPIFILAFARPELAARREGWPAGRRAATIVPLEPLDDSAIREIVRITVDALPDQAVERIVAQAQGIPLYAVETLRALVDRGAIQPVDGRLVATGDLGELEVPATLTALLSSRVDALAPHERAVVKAMSVFGGSFPREAAAALTDLNGDRLDQALRGLTRKQVFVIAADPLSPKRGHYTFAQGLFRTVAYGLLTRRDRKRLHLAAADHLTKAFAGEGEEVAEIIAAHLLKALGATRPEEPGHDALRQRTVAALRRAARRAATIGAPEIAQRAYAEAADLSEDLERAELVQAAGEMALQAGRRDDAVTLLDTAAAAYHEAGRLRESAMTAGPAGWALIRLGRNREAVDRITRALDTLTDSDEINPDKARLNAVLGAALATAGEYERSVAASERALAAAEAHALADVLVAALTAKGTAYALGGRPLEAGSLFGLAVQVALQHGVDAALYRAQGNLANVAMTWDLSGAADHADAAMASCRRRGDPHNESITSAVLAHVLLLAGRWDELDQLTHDLLDRRPDRPHAELLHQCRILLHAARGDGSAAADALGHLSAWESGHDNVEATAEYISCVIMARIAQGDAAAALDTALHGLPEVVKLLTPAHESVRDSWPDAFDAALQLGRLADAQTLLALLADGPPGRIPPYLRAHLTRAQALLAAAQGHHDGVEDRLHVAVDRFEQLAYPLWLAVTRTDLAAWLIEQGRGDEAAPLLGEAIPALTALGARPALARANAVREATSAVAT